MENSWTPTTKRIIVVGSVIALYILINHISAIVPPLIITLILAYILSPVADSLSARLRLNRTLVVVGIYLVLIGGIITLPATLIPPLIAQIENFIDSMPDIIREMGEFIEKPLIFGDFTLDLQDVYEQTSSSLQGLLSSFGTQTISILSDIASALFWTFFVLVASFYLVKDSAIIMRWFDEVTPPAYQHDVRRLRSEIAASWNAFLRGQLILCLVMGLVVGITMALIGLPYAWLIGLLFGILEFIPNLGPTIASVPTVLIALLEGSDVLNLSNGWFAVLVIIINFLLQQLENNLLVPRIMGQSLNLHPLVVLVAAIIGARVAGVLGILLAAPTVATLRVLAEYTYYRLLDVPPFPEQRVQAELETTGATEGEAKAARPNQTEAGTEDEHKVQQAQPAVLTEGKQSE
jgi:predicted PurR-regulated permease PerM